MDIDVRTERAKALYSEDRDSKIRKSHENPDMTLLYEDFLKNRVHILRMSCCTRRTKSAEILIIIKCPSEFRRAFLLDYCFY